MSILSRVYDELLGDEEGIKLYYDFVKNQMVSFPLLECACGSGDLLSLLSQLNLAVIGIDLDDMMVKRAREKYNLQIFQNDMCDLSKFKNFQTILCFGDSLNYLNDLKSVNTFFKEVYRHLEPDGLFLFDCHSLDRLDEFKDTYFEEGEFSLGQYQWTIDTIEKQLIHQFVFYVEKNTVIEQVIQTVFSPDVLLNLLEDCGFNVTIKTDFYYEGICVGEKYFFICRKEG